MTSDINLHDILDSSRPLRVASLTNLSGLDDYERAELQGLLPGVPAERRQQIAQSLIDLTEDNATLDFETVFRALLDDAEPEVRRLAIEGLWEVEDRYLIDPLIHLLSTDPDPRVRATAALALGRYVVLNEFGTLRPRDAERVIEALRAAIDDSEQPLEVRARAVEAAGAASAPWVTEMIWRAFDDEAPRLQISAIHAMGRNASPDWLPTLYDELESADPQRRFEAAGAAGRVGDEDAVPYLADRVEDEDAEVQEAAIAALGEIGGDLAVETLRGHLQHADIRVRDAVRAAIAEAQATEGLVGPAQIRPVSGDDAEDDE